MATLEQLKKSSGFFSTMILLIVLTVVAGGFIVNNLYKRVSKINQEVQANEAVRQAYEQKVKDLDTLKQNYVRLETEVPGFRDIVLGVLPDKTDEERFLVNIKNLAETAGILVSGMNITSVSTPKSSPSFRITLSIDNTSFPNLIVFFKLLETSSRITNVSNISLTGTELLRPSIIMDVFYKPLTTSGAGSQ